MTDEKIERVRDSLTADEWKDFARNMHALAYSYEEVADAVDHEDWLQLKSAMDQLSSDDQMRTLHYFSKMATAVLKADELRGLKDTMHSAIEFDPRSAS